MNQGLTLIVSFFSFIQASFREFEEVGLSLYTWVFTKACLGPWLRGDFTRGCNKLHSTICIFLLSEFVSLNAWEFFREFFIGGV